MREGGRTVSNTLNGGGTEQSGGDKDFKNGRSKLGQEVGALKRGRWNPFKDYGTSCCRG